MGSWAENARRYKREQANDPPERRRRSGPQIRPTRKVLVDRLDAARKDFLTSLERRETYGKDSWWAGGLEWSLKRYEKALKNCLDFGIDVKA